jgi:hypothetical protein
LAEALVYGHRRCGIRPKVQTSIVVQITLGLALPYLRCHERVATAQVVERCHCASWIEEVNFGEPITSSGYAICYVPPSQIGAKNNSLSIFTNATLRCPTIFQVYLTQITHQSSSSSSFRARISQAGSRDTIQHHPACISRTQLHHAMGILRPRRLGRRKRDSPSAHTYCQPASQRTRESNVPGAVGDAMELYRWQCEGHVSQTSRAMLWGI